jgi:serine/threonine protein kinase
VTYESGGTLGHYRILHLLGKGGMGEVYLAEDTVLDRKVALKVLSAQSTSDAERVMRFVQEAKAASALNHPNIVTIYEIGESGGTRFMATEFIDGSTLRQHISASRQPLRDVLDYASQIASALAAAHEAGIVHRDIKPENIMIRTDGYIKVVDFGLAKLTERAPASEDSATVAMAVNTTAGTVMGTVQYMSPEQARGLPLDARTDIFSFGVVLYEMLTGQAPFRGETQSHQIVAILERQPQPLSEMAPGIPPELDRIATKALAKSKDDRYQTARDLALDLKQLRRRLDVDAELTQSGRVILTDTGAIKAAEPEPAPKSRPRSDRLSSVAIVLGVLLVIAGASWWAIDRFAGRAVPFRNYKLTQLTETGKAQSAVISPDGRYVVYTESERGRTSLHIRQVRTGSNVQIQPPATDLVTGLAFSREGDFLYFSKLQPATLQSAVYRTSALGGDTTKILDDVVSAVTFSPDNQRIAFMRIKFDTREQQLVSARMDGGDQRILKAVKRPAILTTGPAWSPDGKTIAIGVSNPSPAGYYGTVVGVPAAGGPDQLINPHRWAGVLSVAWMSDGRGLLLVGATPGVATSTQLWFAPVSKGEPVQLTNDGNSYSDVSVTAAGKALVAVKHEIISGLAAQDAGNPAALREITSPGPYYSGVSGMTLTPDGKLIYSLKQASGLDLWMRGLEEDAKPQRLTNDSAIAMQPCLSSDGKRLVFASNRGTKVFHIWSLDRDAGSLQQLTSGQGELSPALSPDGKFVIYKSMEGPGLWKVSTAGGAAEKFTSAHYSDPVFSPDGRTIAFTFSDEKAGRKPRFGIMPATGGDPIKIFDFAVPAGGSQLQFTVDGSALSYAADNAGVAQVWNQPLDGSPPKQLTQFHSEGIFAFAWSKDGKQLVLSRGVVNSDAVLIEETK